MTIQARQHRRPASSPGRHPYLLFFCFAVAVATLTNLKLISAQSAVGDQVCAEGYPMDYFCVAMGVLFDNPSIVTLEGPDQHSVHCLIEVTECINTPYEILLPPTTAGGLHTRGYRLDDTAKADVQALAQRVGICGSCEGSGTIQRGLAVVVQGKVVQEAGNDVPPTISGTVTLSDPNSPVCTLQAPAPSPVAAATPSPDGTEPPTSLAVTPTKSPTSVSPTTTIVRPTAVRVPSSSPTLQPVAQTPIPTSTPTPGAVSSSMPSSIPTAPPIPSPTSAPSTTRTPVAGASPTGNNESSTATSGGGSRLTAGGVSAACAVASMVVAIALTSL